MIVSRLATMVIRLLPAIATGTIAISLTNSLVLGHEGQRSEDSVAAGKALVNKQDCANCHIIEGQGGIIAPPLDGIGSHRSREYIVQRLSQAPRSGTPSAGYPVPAQLMSHVYVVPHDAELIAQYLATLPARPDELLISGHDSQLADEVPQGSEFVALKKSAASLRGLNLYQTNNCAACHSIGELGGHLGPNLAGVGARRSRDYLANRISKGAVLIPKTGQTATKFSMPPAKLSAKDIDDITSFLLTLPVEAPASSKTRAPANDQ